MLKCFRRSFVSAQVSSKYSNLSWKLCSGRTTAVHPPSTALGIAGAWYYIKENLFWGVRYATGISTKCDSLYYYKMRQKFIKKCVRFFITKYDHFMTKCDSYYKMWRFCFKMQQFVKKCTPVHLYFNVHLYCLS